MIRTKGFRALALGTVLLGTATACSGSGGSKASTSSTTAAASSGPLTAGTGFVTVASVSGDHPLAAADQRALKAAVLAYVKNATVAPLEGKPTTALAGTMVPAAAASLQGPDATTFTDAGLPRATGVKVKVQPISLHGLADSTGAIDLVGSTLDVTVNATTKAGPITIHRSGQLMFERDSGTWKILGYQLAVTRDGAGLGSASSSTTTAKAQP
jgi:hypothetical protein